MASNFKPVYDFEHTELPKTFEMFHQKSASDFQQKLQTVRV